MKKKKKIINQANQAHNKGWELVHILEDEGKIQKTQSIRRPSFYINSTTEIFQLSDIELLVVERHASQRNILDYRLITFDPHSYSYTGSYNPF